MTRKFFITLALIVSLFSVTLVAQANLNKKDSGTVGVTFDSANHTYHPTSSIPYSSQPIEQKFLTIKSINAYESSLENIGRSVQQ